MVRVTPAGVAVRTHSWPRRLVRAAPKLAARGVELRPVLSPVSVGAATCRQRDEHDAPVAAMEGGTAKIAAGRCATRGGHAAGAVVRPRHAMLQGPVLSSHEREYDFVFSGAASVSKSAVCCWGWVTTTLACVYGSISCPV